MRLNENLSNGTLASDVSSEHECPTCEGGGTLEITCYEDGKEVGVTDKTCPNCAGLGVLNERVKR